MFDLSVSFNLVTFVILLALCAAWTIFLIDAAISGKKAVKTAAVAVGAVGIVASAVFIFLALAVGLGLMTLSGNAAVIFGLKLPHLARFADLFVYPVTWAFTAAMTVLSVLSLVFGKIGKKDKNNAEQEESVSLDEQGDEGIKEQVDSMSEVAAAAEKRLGESEGVMGDMLGMMEEISGLVDSLDGKTAPGGEIDSSEYFMDFSDDESETVDEDFYDEETPAEEKAAEKEDEPDKERPAEERPEEQVAKESVADEEKEPVRPDKERNEGESAATVMQAEPVAFGRPRKDDGSLSEVSEFTTVPSEKGYEELPKAKSRTIVRSPEAKEARPVEGGLPMSRRHVLMNRRNVVNMFSEYLNSKSEKEKAKIESSINTIIIK